MTSCYSQTLRFHDDDDLWTKRRKLRHLYSLFWEPDNITDLPISPITHVASFLTAPSRAFLAIALYGARENIFCVNLCSKQPNNSCYWWDRSLKHSIRALMGSECENLDFGDVEKSLAVKINDAHLVQVLFCFDAVNKVKKIRLTHCININGAGLWPLRGSTVVEQIDLSVVTRHKSPKLWKKLQIRRELHFNLWRDTSVVRTLDSIISQEGNALKHLQLHWSWRELGEYSYWRPNNVDQLIMRYNNMLESRGIVSCSMCTINLPARAVRIDDMSVQLSFNKWAQIDAAQHHTCLTCLRNYCDECVTTENNAANEMDILEYCHDCEGFQCQDCRKKDYCERCGRIFCAGTCGALKDCTGCPGKVCSRCSFESTCVRCNSIYCGECRDVSECNICLRHWCRDCLPSTQCDHECGINICDECISKRKCDQCNSSFCGNCRSISECKMCKQRCCSDCDPSRAWGRDERNGYCAECASKQADS